MAVDFKRRVSADPVDRLAPVRRPFRSLLFGTSFHWRRSSSLPVTRIAQGCVSSFSVILSWIRSHYSEIWCRRSSVLWRSGTWSSTGNLEVAGTTVRGRIEWDSRENGRLPCVVIDGRRVDWSDFGATLMAFEGGGSSGLNW